MNTTELIIEDEVVGMDRELPLGPLGEREQDVTDVGGKWHLNDIAATIGIGSLQGFPDRLRRRQAIGRRYREELEGVRGGDASADAERPHACLLRLRDAR
jgi:dTDP-4-amino-4,6-dideoxygalactose transaminase